MAKAACRRTREKEGKRLRDKIQDFFPCSYKGHFRIFRLLILPSIVLFVEPAFSDSPNCLYSLNKAVDAPQFKDFPVLATSVLRPARPILSSQNAKEFRTILRAAAKTGPNFAGHYTIAVWGCGSSCTDSAIIDSTSGKVFFDSRLRDISGAYIDDSNLPTYNSLRFRLDSSLLVVLGAPGENEKNDGIFFYEWTEGELKLLKFMPAESACTKILD
jgi:hypothetical protein